MCSSTLLAVTPTHQPIGTVRPVVRLLSSYRNYTSTHRLQVNTLRALDRGDGGCTGVFEPTRPVASATVTCTPAHDHRLIMGGRPSSSAEWGLFGQAFELGGIFPGQALRRSLTLVATSAHLPAAGSRGLCPWAPVAEEDTSTHVSFHRPAQTLVKTACSRPMASASNTYFVTKTKWTCMANTQCLPRRISLLRFIGQSIIPP